MSQIKKEVRRFLVVGICAFGTDMSVYYLLFTSLGHSLSKATSFVMASILAYVLNKYWTFSQEKKSYSEMIKFVALYLTTLGANVAVNKIALRLFPSWVLFAFLSASGTSTVLNFTGQKWWVFKARPVPDR